VVITEKAVAKQECSCDLCGPVWSIAAMTSPTPRRIVTGHDDDGRSVVLSDAPTPTTAELENGAAFHEIWATGETPAPIAAAESELTNRPLQVPPDPEGTIVHVIDMPPGAVAPMHRTKSIDYGVVLDGEVDLELDDGSVVTLAKGDIVVQRGTAHAWHNRSSETVRMFFVNVDGEFNADMRSRLGDDVLSNLYGA
jgi:quercetin dioxygenase-like cupin family protein